jgi:muramoyltetrapeptide carboxypeptidase
MKRVFSLPGMAALRVGIVACSSPVGLLELERGVRRLRAEGFESVVHPNVLHRHFVNAGTDEARAQSLLDYAYDDSIDVVWCARGGYGAARVARLVEEMTRDRPVPKPKTLVGYSDVTFLHEFVRQRWGWRTIHAPMVSAMSPHDAEFEAAVALVRGERPALAYESPCLQWLAHRPGSDLVGDLHGGNLTLWATLAGTPWQPTGAGRILFFEDVGEKLYRLDRYVVQLEQAGMLEGAHAIVLGDFTDCDDEAPTALSEDGTGKSPLRPTVSLDEGLAHIFGRVATRLKIPLARGLPVGHGPNFWPVELGVRHTLTPAGALKRT